MRIRRVGGHAARIPRRPPGSRAPADLRCAAARARRWAGRMTTTTRGVSPCRPRRTEAISSPRQIAASLRTCGSCGDERDGPIGTIARSSPTPGPARRHGAAFIPEHKRSSGLVATTAPPGDAAARGRVSRPSSARPTQSSGPTLTRAAALHGAREVRLEGGQPEFPSFRPEPARLVGAPVTTRGAAFDVRAEREVRSWAPTMSRTVPLRRRTKW
jgi:hypothetical protein